MARPLVSITLDFSGVTLAVDAAPDETVEAVVHRGLRALFTAGDAPDAGTCTVHLGERCLPPATPLEELDLRNGGMIRVVWPF